MSVYLNATMAGETFPLIVRMNDGPEHQLIRAKVDAWFALRTTIGLPSG